MAVASRGRECDHFHLLVFCALESELQAARRVLEHGTDSTFTHAHTGVVAGLLLCRRWNKTPLTVALISQPDVGGTACNARLTELQKHFSVNFVVMTGACAGEEDIHGGVEYGTVVIARSTAMEEGAETAGGDFRAQGNPEKLDSDLVSVIESVKGRMGRCVGGNTDWMDTIPPDARLPSPRYAQELILDEVVKSGTGISKRELLGKLRAREGLSQMHARTWDAVLKTAEEVGWVSVTAGVVQHMEQGIAYKNDAFEFPREDEIKIVVGPIGTIGCEIRNLPNVLGKFRKRMAQWKLKGIEMSAHHFMTHCKVAFPGCLPLVMKGISDYGNSSRQEYYKEYAASTPVALLRYFLTQEPFYDFLSSRFQWKHLSAQLLHQRENKTDGTTGTLADLQSCQESNRRLHTVHRGIADVPRHLVTSEEVVEGLHPKHIIDATVAVGCHEWFSIGLRLLNNSSLVTDVAAPHATGTAKLEALISTKLGRVSPSEVARELLKIVKEIPSPIYAAVKREAHAKDLQQTGRS